MALAHLRLESLRPPLLHLPQVAVAVLERAVSLRVTVIDEQTGERRTGRLAEGDYLILCAEPCYVDNVQHFRTGTAMLTLKGRAPKPLPSDPIPHEDVACRDCYERGWSAAAYAAFKSLPQEEDE